MSPWVCLRRNIHLFELRIMSLIGPFLGAGLIQDMTSFTGETAVLAWMLTCYSLVALRKREPDLERPYKIPGGMAMGIFASVVTTVVFVLLFIPGSPPYVGPLAIKMFFGWMIIGLILYLASAGQRKGMTEKDLRAGVFAGMEERKATHTKHG
ncbi:MAG: hypothetical protein SOR61_04415 [Evtepia sp.]|uniref:hypothetical protein n=1 Tax=Evtepia sp. TaxID=2773933 RepID=UPI002A76224F|nr:hypothetical protein [Evtepia sp.]MDY3014426.1 hypothetical protein [Evtepia sp.]